MGWLEGAATVVTEPSPEGGGVVAMVAGAPCGGWGQPPFCLVRRSRP
jgi:hypothetical protein